MTVAHQGRLQSFKAENSLICCALPGSLAEVMEFSISQSSVLVCGCIIPSVAAAAVDVPQILQTYEKYLYTPCVSL